MNNCLALAVKQILGLQQEQVALPSSSTRSVNRPHSKCEMSVKHKVAFTYVREALQDIVRKWTARWTLAAAAASQPTLSSSCGGLNISI